MTLHPIVHYPTTLDMVRAFLSGGIFRSSSRIPYTVSDFAPGTMVTLSPVIHDCPTHCTAITISVP